MNSTICPGCNCTYIVDSKTFKPFCRCDNPKEYDEIMSCVHFAKMMKEGKNVKKCICGKPLQRTAVEAYKCSCGKTYKIGLIETNKEES